MDDPVPVADDAGGATAHAYVLASPGVAVHRRALAAKLGTWAIGAWASTCPGAALAELSGIPGAMHSALVGGGLALLFAAGTALALAALVLALPGWCRPAQVRVDGQAVHLVRPRRTRSIPRAEVQDALVIPARPGAAPRVEVRLTRARTLRVDVPAGGAADELLDALGCDASRRRTRLEPRSRGRAVALGVGVGFTAYFACFFLLSTVARVLGEPDRNWPVGPAMGLAAILGMLTAMWQRLPRFTVGADGVAVQRFWKREFVSLDGVDAASVTADGVVLAGPGSTLRVLRTGNVAAAPLAALAMRINDTLAARRRTGLEALEPVALARQGRTMSDWRRALASLPLVPAAFRDAGLDRTTLLRVLEDARASVEHRLAAALALAARPDPVDRARVRAVAGTIADERVRVVLERVAEGVAEDDDLARALAAADGQRTSDG